LKIVVRADSAVDRRDDHERGLPAFDTRSKDRELRKEPKQRRHADEADRRGRYYPRKNWMSLTKSCEILHRFNFFTCALK
jgi:hypothetical protein